MRLVPAFSADAGHHFRPPLGRVQKPRASRIGNGAMAATSNRSRLPMTENVGVRLDGCRQDQAIHWSRIGTAAGVRGVATTSCSRRRLSISGITDAGA